MAAPTTKHIGDLNGKWLLNKQLSDNVDPALQLQGIGWLVRKAIGAASVTLHVKQYTGDDDGGKPHIDIQQTATAGVKGTTENRVLDWTPREHKDWLFGTVQGQSRFISAADLGALLAEGGQARADNWADADAARFLQADWLLGPDEEKGPGGAPFVLNFVRNTDAAGGWTGCQVWGFQDVGGERRYARNVVIGKAGKYVCIKMIYDWIPE
ncbi:hypothetical protein F4780DRAFT_779016 [Xylariomycetidae sp. FL0641]|nr:hypothetical protein F4780DRAFT_779016 [Xylariomycetidae sp. FL0641]